MRIPYPRRALCVLALLVLGQACGATSVGNSCTVDEGCDRGQICFTDFPGGFCSKPCTNIGTTAECPADTVCSQHSNAILCAPACQSQEQCRDEYQCNGVSGSEVKTCKPKV